MCNDTRQFKMSSTLANYRANKAVSTIPLPPPPLFRVFFWCYNTEIAGEGGGGGNNDVYGIRRNRSSGTIML